MKPAPTALIDYFNVVRGSADAQMVMADAFLFVLPNGTTFGWTNSEITFSYDGQTYLGNSILIDGLKYKASVGLEADEQTITFAARSDQTFSAGEPLLQSLRQGAFDGSEVYRYRVWWSDVVGGTLIGGVLLFQGRFSEIRSLGRTQAQISVKSDLVLLDIDMPRNVYQATCLHTLYDPGCGLVKASFGTSSTVGAGSTPGTINTGIASQNFAQGSISFTGGANAGVSGTVNSAVNSTSLTLIYPLPAVPGTGDAFTVYYGCDHTPGTCKTKFANLANFRGFPYVPPPQMAI